MESKLSELIQNMEQLEFEKSNLENELLVKKEGSTEHLQKELDEVNQVVVDKSIQIVEIQNDLDKKVEKLKKMKKVEK